VSPEQARIGVWVKVGESGLLPEWRGMTGRIIVRWGHPEYLALDVRLEDGRSQLFWHHELGDTSEGWAGGVTREVS
jgi:hypothetical protein